MQKYPTCSLVIGFYEVCSQALKEEFAFWIDVYRHAANQANPPEELCKNQAFLRMCEPIKHIADFGKFYTYETADDLEFVLAHKFTPVALSKVPEELKTRENIYRILEHESVAHRTQGCLDVLDISFFSDEEFVVGAAAYQIDAYYFFLRIDKPLRKVERVWKTWGTKERIEIIWGDIPMIVKQLRTFAEHLLAIGNGVSISGPVFAEMWKNFPDLAEALEDEYVREIDSKRNSFGNPLSEYEKRERLKNIPDEQLCEIVSKKLFG